MGPGVLPSIPELKSPQPGSSILRQAHSAVASHLGLVRESHRGSPDVFDSLRDRPPFWPDP